MGMALVALGGVVVACQDPEPTKSPLVCEDQGHACPEQTAKPTPPKGATKELPVTPVKVDQHPADAGADSGDAVVVVIPPEAGPPGPLQGPPGPLCATLMDCCTSLRNAGYSGFAATCDATSAKLNEASCSSENETYRTPDEAYEPVCF